MLLLCGMRPQAVGCNPAHGGCPTTHSGVQNLIPTGSVFKFTHDKEQDPAAPAPWQHQAVSLALAPALQEPSAITRLAVEVF